jgi:hypothetical protein
MLIEMVVLLENTLFFEDFEVSPILGVDQHTGYFSVHLIANITVDVLLRAGLDHSSKHRHVHDDFLSCVLDILELSENFFCLVTLTLISVDSETKVRALKMQTGAYLRRFLKLMM